MVASCPQELINRLISFYRCLKRFNYIRFCDTTVSVLIDSSGCDLSSMLFNQAVCASFAASTPRVQWAKRSWWSARIVAAEQPWHQSNWLQIWGIIQQGVYQTKLRKCRIWRIWCSICLMYELEWNRSSVIDSAIDQLRRIRATGGHSEYTPFHNWFKRVNSVWNYW